MPCSVSSRQFPPMDGMRRWRARLVVASTCPRRHWGVAQDAGRASVAASPWHEVADQAIAVAAVDRANELAGAPCLGDCRSLEKKCGRVKRDAEDLCLFLARHGGLDGLG